jgi:pimeloyl-ACP methyl ester carboxylesterase
MRASSSLVYALVIVGQSSAVSAQSHFLDANGVRIHYTVTGTGPAVVLIHGWGLNLREWTDQIAALSPHYRVIAFDRRGFGKSNGDSDPSAEPADVRALLDTLGIRSAALVAHSAGAMVAQRFAAAMPGRVNALVLYGGPPPAGFSDPQVPPPQFDGRGTGRGAIARQYGVDSVLRAFISQPQFVPGPNRSPAVAARLDSILKEYSGRDLLNPITPSGTFPGVTLAQMKSWRFPVLFISGVNEARPWQVMSDSLARWMPNARRILIPGGGHGVHFDEPQRFNAALLDFLNSSVKPASPP